MKSEGSHSFKGLRLRNHTKGIFCLEDDWWGTMKTPSSLELILHLLNQWVPYRVPYIHRNAGTRSALEYYLSKWTQKSYREYCILYLAFHGSPGEIHLGSGRGGKTAISLDWLEDQLQGKCKGRIIYVAGCGTMEIHGARLNSFLRRTGALAVCGYVGWIDWMRGAAFDLLVLAAMQDNALTIAGAKAMKRRIEAEGCGLSRDLQFRMVIRARCD